MQQSLQSKLSQRSNWQYKNNKIWWKSRQIGMFVSRCNFATNKPIVRVHLRTSVPSWDEDYVVCSCKQCSSVKKRSLLKSFVIIQLLLCCDQLAKAAFQASKDPLDAAVFYLAMKKKSLLWGLFRWVSTDFCFSNMNRCQSTHWSNWLLFWLCLWCLDSFGWESGRISRLQKSHSVIPRGIPGDHWGMGSTGVEK